MSQDFHSIVGTAPRANRTLRIIENSASEPPVVCDDDPSTPKPSTGRRSWAESDGTFWAVQKASPIIPCGVYRMGVSQQMGPYFQLQKNDTDTLMALPDSESEKVLEEIKLFKTLKPAFEKHGFLYKRGILLWGPPGSGKTSTLQQLIRLLVDEHNSIAVLVDHPLMATQCLQTLRAIEPERQIIAIMEDIDALTEKFGESEYLALLDGESQVNNIVFVATTNYPERLDKRFTDRPSRFDTVRYVGMPSAAARHAYLHAKIGDRPELDTMVSGSDGFSIAHLRELIILTQCFGRDLDDALGRLRKTINAKPSSTKSPDAPAFGFTTAAAFQSVGVIGG